MEGLIELVGASFARHGIKCPAGDSTVAQPAPSEAIRSAESTLTSALPEHNFRKGLQGDPAP